MMDGSSSVSVGKRASRALGAAGGLDFTHTDPTMSSSLFRRHAAGAFLLILGLLAAGPLRAQTLAGFDDFDDNTLTVGAGQRWRFDADLTGSGGTAFTEQNQRLEFTSGNATGVNGRVLGWTSPSASAGSYGLDWSASVTVTNLTTPVSGYTLAGLETYTLTDLGAGVQSSAYYGLYLESNANGNNLRVEWGLWNGTTEDYDRTALSLAAVGTATNVLLNLAWDASLQSLVASYSVDGGLNYLTGGTFSLSGAQAGLGSVWSDGFGLELAGVASGTVVTAGQITFDNMSVSAVPEPSTYAALAGALALGLACWRRRAAGAKA